MRIESTVSSITWIPSEAVRGMLKMPFDMGVTHYDPAPPDVIEDLDALRLADRFRFANQLAAWIEVEDGQVVGHGCSGGGLIGATTVRVAGLQSSFAAVALPDLRPSPEVRPDSVRFVQTAGGRTGLPTPRRVRHKPFVQLSAPLAWTTLSLTLHADGRVEREVVGASPFPRHWIYDGDGSLCAKSGLIDFTEWYRTAFGKHTPWGDRESPALVTSVETALERELSRLIMAGSARPAVRTLTAGSALVRQGDPGDELFLLLDGVLRVDVDGEPLTEIGPGAILGERAVLEGGVRTSSLTAVTACRVAVASAAQVDRAALEELATGHRREVASTNG
jgi:hypothetical protein